MKNTFLSWSKLSVPLIFVLCASCIGQPATSLVTPSVIASPLQTATQTVLPSPTQKKTPTQAVIPTLFPGQPEDAIRELYKTNNGCQLPCLWGIVPGKTAIEEVYDRFSLLGSFREVDRLTQDTVWMRFTFSPPKDIDLYNEGEWGISLQVSNGIVEGLTFRSSHLESFSHITLASILAAFGKPTEIWLMVVPSQIDPPYYNIALFYPELGILIRGQGDTQVITEMENGIDLSICPQDMATASEKNYHHPILFHLWSPDEKMTFTELNNTHFTGEKFTLLENMLTDIDTTKFYETYLDSATKECFNLSLRAK